MTSGRERGREGEREGGREGERIKGVSWFLLLELSSVAAVVQFGVE